MRPWDAQLIDLQPSTSLVGIAREGRLVREDAEGPAGVDVAWVDEAALALIDLAVAKGRDLCLVYPAPAGELSVLIAAQLLLHAARDRVPIVGARHTLLPTASFSVGIVTADATFAARAWDELRIRTTGDRVPVAECFPCWRAGPNGESPMGGRDFQGLLVGERCMNWPVDVLIEDHLAGPVNGTGRRCTIALFADPLDPDLLRRVDNGDMVWGWSDNDISAWNATLETDTDNRLPFSVSHARLATIAAGVSITVQACHHADAEGALKRVREDLGLLREVTGPQQSPPVARAMAIAWQHVRTLLALPCSPTRFDRYAGVPPWAPRATSTFEREIAAWARTLSGDAADVAGVLASDIGDLRAALDHGNPFQLALEEAAQSSRQTLLVMRSRAAGRALLDAVGADPDDSRIGNLVLARARRLNRQGSWERAIVLGAGARWEWHRLDSGVAGEVRVLVLGDQAAAESCRMLSELRRARSRWGGPEIRERTWRELVGGAPPAAQPVRFSAVERVRIAGGPEFVPEPDPFEMFDVLFQNVPLHIGPEGLEERLAREDETGKWSATALAVTIHTDRGAIRLEVGQPVEVREGPRIVDKVPAELVSGDRLLIGRRRGRIGLLEALEERLQHRRPDLLAGRLLIESYQQRVRERFVASGLSIAALHRKLTALGCDKTVFAIRSWVLADGTLAPRDEADLDRLNVALELGLNDRRLAELFAGVQRRRGFRRAAGKILAEAARSSTIVADHARIDAETGLSVADLREAVVEAVVVSVDDDATEVPVSETARLEDA